MSVTLTLIDRVANSVEAAHVSYQTSLRALLAQFLDRSDAHAPRARGELMGSLHDARMHACSGIYDLISQGIDDVVDAAETDVDGSISDDLQQDLIELESQALDVSLAQVSDALRMDEDMVLSTFRKLQLRATMKIAQGVDPKVAFDMVKSGAITAISFSRVDRSGSRWSTSIYTRTVVRALAVNSYTETFCMYLLSEGLDVASITGEHGNQIKFSITGNDPALSTLTGIQADYLHPNASRLITRWTD